MKKLFIAQGAVICGDVTMGNNVSIWYNAVLRGDMAPITIGDNSNVQECSVLHVSENMPLVIGEGVTVYCIAAKSETTLSSVWALSFLTALKSVKIAL